MKKTLILLSLISTLSFASDAPKYMDTPEYINTFGISFKIGEAFQADVRASFLKNLPQDTEEWIKNNK